MSFSERAAVQELARGSDTEGFCASVAFLNSTRDGQGHSGSHVAAKRRYVLEFYVSIFRMASKQNEIWDKSALSLWENFVSVLEHGVTATATESSRCTRGT